MRKLLLMAAAVLPFVGCGHNRGLPAATGASPMGREMGMSTNAPEGDWKQRLSPEQYRVLREKGTEPAFTGKYWNNHESGMYVCAGCGQELFSSKTKFDSGTGWPSFWDAVDKSKVALHDDSSLAMQRVEVTCAQCGGHLGHLFDDGPQPTGQRYCINSASLEFKERGK